MRKTNPLRTAAVVGTLTVAASGIAAANDVHSFSANIGAVSNYFFRGITQTDDGPAIQGGIDYSHISGFYAGTWASNVDFGDQFVGTLDPNTQIVTIERIRSPGYEVDLYLGFAKDINDDLSFDLGAIYYAYPDGRDLDFAEVNASGSWKWLTLGVAYTIYGKADRAPGVNANEALYIEGDLYYHGALDFDLPYDFTLGLFGGYTDFRYDGFGTDYGHWGASIGREVGDFGTFSLNYEQVGRDNDNFDRDPKIWVGWLKEF